MGKSSPRNYLIRTGLFAVVGLFISSIAIAGVLIVLSCNNCGFQSGDLYAEFGKAGIKNAVVYCPVCKKFETIPTKIHYKTRLSEGLKVSVPIGKEKFFGKECLTYSCPKCGGKTFEYKGPICPICLKGKISERDVGLWD